MGGGGGLPPIVSQPTTPLDSPLVNRRLSPLERREVPRRVADRSVAMRPAKLVLGVALVVAGSAGWGRRALYYYKARGFAPGKTVSPADSTAPYRDSTPPTDSLAAQVPPKDSSKAVPHRSRGRLLGHEGSGCRLSRGHGQPVDVVGPVDSGGIRLMGLPRGSTVMIDEKAVTEALTKLPPGPHALGDLGPALQFLLRYHRRAAGTDPRS